MTTLYTDSSAPYPDVWTPTRRRRGERDAAHPTQESAAPVDRGSCRLDQSGKGARRALGVHQSGKSARRGW